MFCYIYSLHISIHVIFLYTFKIISASSAFSPFPSSVPNVSSSICQLCLFIFVFLDVVDIAILILLQFIIFEYCLFAVATGKLNSVKREGEGASAGRGEGSEVVEGTGASAAGGGVVAYKFNEGNTNAIRRKVYLSEFC